MCSRIVARIAAPNSAVAGAAVTRGAAAGRQEGRDVAQVRLWGVAEGEFGDGAVMMP